MKSPKPNIIWDSSEYAGDEVMYYSCIDNNDLIIKWKISKSFIRRALHCLMALWPNITYRRLHCILIFAQYLSDLICTMAKFYKVHLKHISTNNILNRWNSNHNTHTHKRTGKNQPCLQ